MSNTTIIFNWIKRSPVATAITTFIIFNLVSIILHGSVGTLSILANLIPTIFSFFVSSIYNEKVLVDETKKEM